MTKRPIREIRSACAQTPRCWPPGWISPGRPRTASCCRWPCPAISSGRISSALSSRATRRSTAASTPSSTPIICGSRASGGRRSSGGPTGAGSRSPGRRTATRRWRWQSVSQARKSSSTARCTSHCCSGLCSQGCGRSGYARRSIRLRGCRLASPCRRSATRWLRTRLRARSFSAIRLTSGRSATWPGTPTRPTTRACR